MPLRRRLTGTLVAFATAACWAIAPGTADAALLDPVEAGAGTAAAPVQKAADVTRAIESAAGLGHTPAARPVPAPATPGPSPEQTAVQQTVAPIADATAAAVPAAAPAAAAAHLREPHRSRIRRISASVASNDRMGSARFERSERVSGAMTARKHAAHGLARIDSSDRPTASSAPATSAGGPAVPAPEPSSGLAGAGGAAGGSSGFSSGGGLALLVAALLLAGPRLHRRLSLLPAVCRPVAFLVVLERPG